MNEKALYRRIARRARFASRSTAVVVVLVVVILAAGYVGAEFVVSALGRRPLLVAPSAAVQWATSGEVAPTAIGVVGAVIALVILSVALSPGRRARHTLPSDRLVIVVDDAIVAGAIAREARLRSRVAANRVHADVSRRSARVVITPTSGIAVDSTATAEAVATLVLALDARPRIRPVTRVARVGKVGS